MSVLDYVIQKKKIEAQQRNDSQRLMNEAFSGLAETIQNNNLLKQENQKLNIQKQNALISAKKEGILIGDDGTIDFSPYEKIQRAAKIAEANETIFEGDLLAKYQTDPESLTPGEKKKVGLFVSQSDKDDYSDIDPQKVLNISSQLKNRVGARGMKALLPTAMKLIRENPELTADEIDDRIRYSGQSESYAKYRGAANNLTMGASSDKTQQIGDFIDDAISTGDDEQIKQALKVAALKTTGVAKNAEIQGKERLIGLLGEVQTSLKEYKDAGGKTNVFKGTREQIAQKIGLIVDPELRAIATKAQVGLFGYIKALSGVAVSEPEARRIGAVFPKIGNSFKLNEALIDTVNETLTGDVDSFYSIAMGRTNYEKHFKDDKVEAKKETTGGDFADLKFPTMEQANKAVEAGKVKIGDMIQIGKDTFKWTGK